MLHHLDLTSPVCFIHIYFWLIVGLVPNSRLNFHLYCRSLGRGRVPALATILLLP